MAGSRDTWVGVCCDCRGGDGGGGWGEGESERESERAGTGEGFVYFCCVILRLLCAQWERKNRASTGDDGGLVGTMSGGGEKGGDRGKGGGWTDGQAECMSARRSPPKQ